MTDITGEGKTYDGTATVKASPTIVITNTVRGDKVACVGSFSYTSADAGTVNITATDIVLSEGSDPNYVLKTTEFTSTTAYTISKAPLDIGKKSVYFNGGKTFTKEFATGVGEEKVILTYNTSSSAPGEYVLTGSDKIFEISYSSPDGKENYRFNSVGSFEIVGPTVTVRFDPNHDEAEVKEVTVKYPYTLTREVVAGITWDNHLNTGWYCENRALLNFDEYVFLQNETFYAKWAEVSGSDLNVETDKKNMEITVTDAINKVNVKFMDSSISLDVTGKTGYLDVSLDNSLSNDIGRYVLNVKWSDMAYTGNITMAIPYDSTLGDPVPYYYPASGDKVKLDGTVDKDKGTITFTAPNCVNAQYGLEYVSTPVPPEPTPSSDSDNTAIIVAAIVIVLAIVGIAAYFYVKKKNA